MFYNKIIINIYMLMCLKNLFGQHARTQGPFSWPDKQR